MSDCLFCKIINGDIPSNKVYEDDKIFAFNDIDPQAPVHFLIIPKQHIPSADYITSENSNVIAHIFQTIAQLSSKLGLENGYRVVNNCGKDGMQSVNHLHFHVLGKKQLGWPPYSDANNQ